MWKFFDVVLDRIFSVLGALVFSQAPSFITQYIQRLAGSTHELKLQVAHIERMAQTGNLSIADYIQTFLKSDNPLFVSQGEFLGIILERYHNFSEALSRLENAFWLTRPLTFLANVNSDLFSGTMKHFTPAVNISMEGLVYTLIGLLVGYFIYQGIRKLCIDLSKGISHAFRRKKDPS